MTTPILSTIRANVIATFRGPRLTRGILAGSCLAATAACNSDRLVVPNYQNPVPGSIQSNAATAVPLLANGVLRNDRGLLTTWVDGVGRLGRESYNYPPTEGRNSSGWLTNDVNNSTSFGGTALWTGYYSQLRDIDNLLGVVEGAPDAVLSPEQKNATRGFAHTLEALTLHYVIGARHDLGAPVEVADDPAQVTPFVSRDSVYNHVIGRLEQAKTELLAGGTTLPLTLHAGYAGFTTPANFLKVNRAIAARVNAYRASLGVQGCGAARSAACYQLVLQNLAESFIDPAGALTLGPVNVYSAAASDAANGLSNAASANVVAHAKSDSGVQLKQDGTRDNRFATKIITIPSKGPGNATLGVNTTFDFSIYPARETSVPIIRNEELILLRAEARYFTGDVPGALADLNAIRTRSGGLAAIDVAAIDTEAEFLDELLYNRRWSLLFEGHRWVDMRRFGRLDRLTRDLPDHVVVPNLPVPQAECLARRAADPSLAAPGCASS